MSTDPDATDGTAEAGADGRVAEEIGIISFGRKWDTAEEIEAELGDRYETIDLIEYEGDVFEQHWGEYDCFVGLMASGIVMRKTADILDDGWDDPAITVVDEELTWAIPVIGGEHGANQVARDLASMGAVPATTTKGEGGIEDQSKALEEHVDEEEETAVATPLAVRDDVHPVERPDGPKVVLVDDDVSVIERDAEAGVVLGTGSVSGATKAQFLDAWRSALEGTDHGIDDVEFVATGTRKEDEEGLQAAAAELGLPIVAFEKETLAEFEGPTPSRSKELIGWPGISEASAIAGGREHELLREKERYDEAVTVAIGN